MTGLLSLISGALALVAAITLLTGRPRRRRVGPPAGAASPRRREDVNPAEPPPPHPAGSPPSVSSPGARSGSPHAGTAHAGAALFDRLGLGGRPSRPAQSNGSAGPAGPPGPAWLGRLLDRLGAARRRRELERAVPEALDVLRATVTAGASPGQGLAAAAELAAGPLAPVLTQAARASRLGVSPGRALADAGARAECIELVTAGEALDLAEVTGAPPGRVLAGVAAAASDRVRARQALMAATAEARLSARVIAGLGPAFLLLLAVAAPREVAFLFIDPIGLIALGLAIAFESAGLLWAARIVRSPL
jgi:hypothetical protein